MNLEEIIESGLLELYVIGELNQYNVSKVEAAIKEEAELKQVVKEIEAALYLYAKANAIVTHKKLMGIIQDKIKTSSVAGSNPIKSSNNEMKESNQSDHGSRISLPER